MANLIQKTVLHPENSKEVDLYPKTSYEQVEGLDGIVAGINNKIDNVPIGEKVSFIFPEKAANGNITDEQLAKLQANEANYIEMVNDKELYYLNDPGHVEGYLTYSHVGIENGKATIKTLTITVSAKSFVIVTTVVPTDAGGKLYRHVINLMTSDSSCFANIIIINSKGTEYPINTPDEPTVIFKEEIDKYFVSGYIYESSIEGYSAPTSVPVLYVDTSSNGQNVYYFVANEWGKYLTFPHCMNDTVTEL